MSFLKNKFLQHIINIFIISFFAIYFNTISGNNGILAPDSFSFLDGSAQILNDKLPIRDYWLMNGVLIHYLQSIFFYFFGINWKTYVFHASFFNLVFGIFSYYFFIKFELRKLFSLIYSISIVILFYPTAGTPIVYFHSSILCLIALFLTYLSLRNKNNHIFFVPLFMLAAYLSGIVPSVYINLVILIILIYLIKSNKKIITTFIIGSFFSILLLAIFFITTETSLTDFLYQQILIPFSIGQARYASSPEAFAQINSITLNKVLDFYYIYIFLIPLILILFKRKNDDKNNLINVSYIFTVFLFIFAQLTSNNQTFIHFLIPISAFFLHKEIINIHKKKFIYLIFLIVFIFTIKFGYRNIIERRFNDFQWTNMSYYTESSIVNIDLNNLKWISPKNFSLVENSNDEINLLNDLAINLNKDNSNFSIFTNYQIFSILLNRDYELLQTAWFKNATHPNPESKYYNYYKLFINKLIAKKKIDKILFLEINSNEYKNFIEKICSTDFIEINNYKITIFDFTKCKK